MNKALRISNHTSESENNEIFNSEVYRVFHKRLKTEYTYGGLFSE